MKKLKPWQAWLAATAALWAVVFAWPSRPSHADALVHPRERWSLPELPALRDLSAQAQAVGASPLWGVAAAFPGGAPDARGAAAAAQEDKRWVLAGIYSRDSDARVVVRYHARRGELLLKTGDALPSGEKIVEIGADSIWVKAAGKKRRIALYSVNPADDTGTARTGAAALANTAGAASAPISAATADIPPPAGRNRP